MSVNVLSNATNPTRRHFLGASGSFLALAACGGGESSHSPVLVPIASPLGTTGSKAPASDSNTIAISDFYQTEHGLNYQPAVQAAIDAAEARGAGKVVNDLGAIEMEMWCPPRTSPYEPDGGESSRRDNAAPDGVPLVVRKAMRIDFAGARITLKGPEGNTRWPGQELDNGELWLGGWLYVIGHQGFKQFMLENVIVEGNFNGPMTQDRRNLSDKAFRVQDTEVGRIELINVELRNFGGEIYYTAGVGVERQQIKDCHFHGSPQCAFNPGTTGRLTAHGLRAGRSYQAVEAIGGISHDYESCVFYDSGMASFLGGPKPGLDPRYPYWYPQWDGVGSPPRIAFVDTVFQRCRMINTGAWISGELELIDTMFIPMWEVGRLHGIQLKIKSTTDEMDIPHAVALGGPERLGIPISGAPEGTVSQPPFEIEIELHCEASEAARSRGLSHLCAFGFYGGLLDAPSIRLTASGQGRSLTRMFGSAVPGFVMPQVLSNGFITV